MFHVYRFEPHTCIDRGIWHSLLLIFDPYWREEESCRRRKDNGEIRKRRKAQGEEKGDHDDEGSERKGKNKKRKKKGWPKQEVGKKDKDKRTIRKRHASLTTTLAICTHVHFTILSTDTHNQKTILSSNFIFSFI